MKYPIGSTNGFKPWQPSTWPDAPRIFDTDFQRILERIIYETIIGEIENVILDARSSGRGLVHRGHVIALAMFCAIDALSAYAFKSTTDACATCGRGDRVGPRYKRFISEFFPGRYRPYTEDLYNLYRNSMVHSWNLFKVGILPGCKQIYRKGGAVAFGIPSFFKALTTACDNFFRALSSDSDLQEACLARYKALKASALP